MIYIVIDEANHIRARVLFLSMCASKPVGQLYSCRWRRARVRTSETSKRVRVFAENVMASEDF